MTALNDAERTAMGYMNREPDSAHQASIHVGQTPDERMSWYPTWLPSPRFLAAVIAIGGMQLLATMDSSCMPPMAITAAMKRRDGSNDETNLLVRATMSEPARPRGTGPATSAGHCAVARPASSRAVITGYPTVILRAV